MLFGASLQRERVMTELRKARQAERQSGQRKLFAVRLMAMETLRDWECFDAEPTGSRGCRWQDLLRDAISGVNEETCGAAAHSRLKKEPSL